MDWMTDNWIWLAPAVGALLVGARMLVKKTKPTWDDKMVEFISSIWGVFSSSKGKTTEKK